MPLKQIEIVVQVNRDFTQNGNKKYDGEMAEGVSCSFAYSSLAVRSHLLIVRRPKQLINTKINHCIGS